MTYSEQIDNFINQQQHDWQKKNLKMFRDLLHEVNSEIMETWKWDVPVFLNKSGKVAYAMSTFNEHTKFNFFYGATLDDKHNLFNSGLDSKKHRSINLAEGEKIDKDKLRDLIVQAME
jgi:hypothetical protein